MTVKNKDFEFEACRVGREIVITLRRIAQPGKPQTGEEINATFTVAEADACEAEIAEAVDEVHGLADCDCCGKERPLSRCFSYGLETFACDECRAA
jgi:hypothetical protein